MNRKRTRIGVSLFAALAVALMSVGIASAQEWSVAQKEVWKSVETYWELGAEEDLDGFMSYFADDYLGWSTSSAMPGTKADVRKWTAHDFKTNQMVLRTLKPVGIAIHGDVAFVHYYFTGLQKNAKDEEKTTRGRWTDILKKQGNRWVLIGDSGGSTSQDD
jgi:ketosteroid isomerase-like protein